VKQRNGDARAGFARGGGGFKFFGAQKARKCATAEAKATTFVLHERKTSFATKPC
jgi:hypothetical protein